ncbi:hypothetical protein IE53DRAFT_56416 [Violaceomyces palustris]|uniref:Uncharacterized protein n=1 Tax=Violaceomyces palustris TaxID=1673888 RepID=A0ACD0NZU8_9BASI|nr:hypothetical protein IE53DRAFT_56416 [Violaceomyces palustris]
MDPNPSYLIPASSRMNNDPSPFTTSSRPGSSSASTTVLPSFSSSSSLPGALGISSNITNGNLGAGKPISLKDRALGFAPRQSEEAGQLLAGISSSRTAATSWGLNSGSTGCSGQGKGLTGADLGGASWMGTGDRRVMQRVVSVPIHSSEPSQGSTAAARNFLVPIGATGARQKLSIGNASQRRKLATSDEVHWPDEVRWPGDPGEAKPPIAGRGLLGDPPLSAPSLSPNQFGTFPRTKSDELKMQQSQASFHEGPCKEAPSSSFGSERPTPRSPLNDHSVGGSDATHPTTLSPSSQLSSSRWMVEGVDLWRSSSKQSADGQSPNAMPRFAQGSPAADSGQVRSQGSTGARPSTGHAPKSPSSMRRGSTSRPLTSTEIVKAALDKEMSKPFDISTPKPGRKGLKEKPSPRVDSTPADPRNSPVSPAAGRNASSVALSGSSSELPSNGIPREATTKPAVKGFFGGRKDSTPPEDQSAGLSTPSSNQQTSSEKEVPTRAEIYKRSMLEREVTKQKTPGAPERPTTSERGPLKGFPVKSPSGFNEFPVEQRPSPMSLSRAGKADFSSRLAPTIDLDLPTTTSLFDDTSAGHPAFGSGRPSEESKSKAGGTTIDSEASVGSYEGSLNLSYLGPSPRMNEPRSGSRGRSVGGDDLFGGLGSTEAEKTDAEKLPGKENAVRPGSRASPDAGKSLPPTPSASSSATHSRNQLPAAGSPPISEDGSQHPNPKLSSHSVMTPLRHSSLDHQLPHDGDGLVARREDGSNLSTKRRPSPANPIPAASVALPEFSPQIDVGGSQNPTRDSGSTLKGDEAGASPFSPSSATKRAPTNASGVAVGGTPRSMQPLSDARADGSFLDLGPSPASEVDLSSGRVGHAAKSNQIVNATSVNGTGIDPSTYVPAGALMRTRKGTAMPAAVKADQKTTFDLDSGFGVGQGVSPALASAWSSEDTSPRFRESRFSEASTDASGGRTPTGNERPTSGLDSADHVDNVDELSSLAGEESSVDGHLLPASAWVEVDNAMRKFRDAGLQSGVDKGNLLRTVLLPFLALEAETATVEVMGHGPFVSGKRRRSLFFEWIRQLLLELQHVQTSADRGAILESIACIIESRNFSVGILSQDEEDAAQFSSVFGHILSYAIGELNKKGVYQNTLIFSGRLLAVAFFRVEGVASKLLRALPVNRFALERVANEAGWADTQPSDFGKYRSKFPPSLQQLCFQDARSYLKMLDSQSVMPANETEAEDDRYLVRQPEVEVEMTGNWLRRWQSDDSELFFSFCRSYHRQLACLFASSRSFEAVSKLFFGGPGYAHLATCIHQKCLALVHRDILSVTTLSSQKNFNPGETANVLSGSTTGKPRHLEAANRRCTAIVVDIVRAPSGNNLLFGPMLGVHVKCLIKRTSLYDVQGVFCLLDWLDGVLSHMEQADLLAEGLIEISFIIQTVSMLLEDADHALALMRTIAFCYSNFAFLTSTRENRIRFCEEILLKPKIFNKLFLSWSFTIRAYYLHLLVFRLARITDFPNPKGDPQGKTAVSIARLFHQRLEDIKKRHDQLSPPANDSSSEEDRSDDLDRPKRRAANSFISTIKHTPSIHTPETTTGRTKAERLLGIGVPDPSLNKNEQKTQSRAKNWLRALRGSKSGSKGTSSPNSSVETKNLSGRARMSPLDEINISEDDGTGSPNSEPGSPRSSEVTDDSSSETSAITLIDSIKGDARSANYEFDIAGRLADGSSSASSQFTPPASDPALGHGDIAVDTSFDLQSPTSLFPPSSPSLPSSGSGPKGSLHSPRISRAFSKRNSILPGPASELVEGDGGSPPPIPAIPQQYQVAYQESLHIYAVQSLVEYEQTVKEHDEFFATQSTDQGDRPQVPRLPVNWPAMWSSTGE